MIDRRSEIPTWAFINAQIVQDAHRSGALAQSIRRVEEGYQLPPGSLTPINSAYAVSLLYCLVVVPKELWLRDGPPPELAALDQSSVLSLVTVTQRSRQFDAAPFYGLLRHLRNALSHVRFEIADDGEFSFWDQPTATSPPNFRATMSQSALERFLSTVGPALANLRDQPAHARTN